MSWMQKLYQTYDQSNQVEDIAKPWPLSHFVKTAHVELVIDGLGNLKPSRTSLLSGEDASTLIPATEASAGKAGAKIAPHPLCEEVGYCASDFPDLELEKNQAYMAQLKAWCDSDFSHPKVKAVYNYLSKNSLWHDLTQLIDFPVIFTNKRGQKTKIPAEKVFIRWRVEELGNPCSATWDDIELISQWIKFDHHTNSKDGLCFVTGNQTRLIGNHPRFIRHSSDGAKLISSNDSSGYTYRGRFLDETQACGIGFEVSQKAHNALRWLVNRQGFRNSDQVYVAWAVSGAQVPQPLADSGMANDSDDFDLEEMTEPVVINVQVDHARNLGQAYARKLSQYMAGYAAKISPNEQITVMGIDSATPGRMSIIYYRELLRDEFFQRLLAWHTQFAWRQRHTQELPGDNDRKAKTHVIWPICAPLPRDIAVAAYGENLDDMVKKKAVERLLPCIIDEAPLPRDLMELCLRKASNRVAYPSDKHWLWEKNLGIACALFKGYYQRHPDNQLRRDYAMALEENRPDRDYLFGRLLAVADYIEEIAQGVGGEKRPTTAARLMQRFADRPFETWRTIELSLQPYMQRLQVSRAGFLTNRNKDIDSILALFQYDDFTRNAALSGEFLLGYHCQRHHFKHKTESNHTSAEGHDANIESGE